MWHATENVREIDHCTLNRVIFLLYPPQTLGSVILNFRNLQDTVQLLQGVVTFWKSIPAPLGLADLVAA